MLPLTLLIIEMETFSSHMHEGIYSGVYARDIIK